MATELDVDVAVGVLEALPWVEYAEPDYMVYPSATPNDQFVSLQWGVNNTGQSIRGITGTPDADIDGIEGWDITTGQAGFVIAVIDSGTQWSHPDLDANIWSNPGEIAGNGIDDDGNGYVDDIRGWDFYNNDNNPDDSDGHGTHTAGTVGAEGNNGIGVAGVNWQCKIMPLRFLGPFGGSTSDAILAVEYAAANGALVSNNSWGGGPFSTALRDTIAASASSGHIFVAAAGNGGPDLIGDNNDALPYYPASYTSNNIISVASIDNRDDRATSSNFGATSVDLGAPGVDIASTWTGSSYVWNSGTSMAAPHVSGVVAQVYQQNPSWSYTQVIDRVLSTVRPTSSMAGITVTGGVLNAAAALAGGGPANTAPSASIDSPSNGAVFTEGDSVTFSGTASDAEDGDLSGSLSWSSSLDGAIGSGASFSTGGLSVGTHTITASVTDSGGLSAADSVSVTIEEDGGGPIDPPAAPGRPSGSDLGGGTALISWNAVSGADGYEVERQQRVGRSWTNTTSIGTTSSTQLTDNAGVGVWRYRVRSYNAAGNSGWSSWRRIRLR